MNRSIVRRAGLAAVLLAAALAAGCKQDLDWVRELEGGDCTKLQFGRAPHGMQPLAAGGDLERQVALAADYFAENPQLLQALAGKCPSIEASALGYFRMTGAMSDPAGGGLMLQFFAEYLQPRLFAGRRVQFVLNADRDLEAVYVSDVPLEQ